MMLTFDLKKFTLGKWLARLTPLITAKLLKSNTTSLQILELIEGVSSGVDVIGHCRNLILKLFS